MFIYSQKQKQKKKIHRLNPSDSYILKYCRKFNDIMMTIDCAFELLDYYQWKYDETCWELLRDLLLYSNKEYRLTYYK